MHYVMEVRMTEGDEGIRGYISAMWYLRRRVLDFRRVLTFNIIF
jgi:hypothetical protein